MPVRMECLLNQCIHGCDSVRSSLPHIRIGNDRPQVVNVWHVRADLRACEHTLVIVLLVM